MTREELQSAVGESTCGFYRSLWENSISAGIVRRADFFQTPIQERRYKNVSSLALIAGSAEEPFVIEWALEDLREESVGDVPFGRKPLVCFRSPHNAVLWSVWCYEHGMVPLIGERNPAVTLATARLLLVDGIITDSASLHDIVPLVEELRLSYVVVVDQSFDVALLNSLRTKVYPVLWLPETGIIGTGELRGNDLTFAADPAVLLEHGDLVVTKLRLLVTPIIRFQTHPKTQIIGGGRFSVRASTVRHL